MPSLPINPRILAPRAFSALPPALTRRIAKRRLPALTRSLHSSPLLARQKLRPSLIPPPTALAALASRLSLTPSEELNSALLACLTHPSFYAPITGLGEEDGAEEAEVVSEKAAPVRTGESNELRALIGNKLLGLFAAEYLGDIYPFLPTASLKIATTAYVGPTACLSVARELGVAVQGGGDMGLPGRGPGLASAGVPVRWSRTAIAEESWRKTRGQTARGPETVPVGQRFQKYAKEEEDGDVEISSAFEKKDDHEDVVASAVRAFIGLIYEEQGIHAARSFAHAHFLSRSMDLATVVRIKQPMQILSSVVSSHLTAAGVPYSSHHTIEPRLLASTGTASQAPIFLVGLFLPSGIKLAEGHGSSKKMALHRAAVNAIYSIWFLRGDQDGAKLLGYKGAGKGVGEFGEGLPSSAHEDRLFADGGKLVVGEDEVEYEGVEWGGKEVLPGSRR
ncbi:hypothetical protein IAT38_007706 [Cryptococcus sp. DSM 104549]